MPGSKLTSAQNAHQKVIEAFGQLRFDFQEQHSTCTFNQGFRFVVSIGIGYKTHQYLSTGLLPFEESPEDHLFPDKA